MFSRPNQYSYHCKSMESKLIIAYKFRGHNHLQGRINVAETTFVSESHVTIEFHFHWSLPKAIQNLSACSEFKMRIYSEVSRKSSCDDFSILQS